MAGVKAHDGSLAQTTRKMLDELDDLMERMLALPISELEEPRPAPDATRTPALAASLTLLEPTRPEPVRTPVVVPAPITMDVTPPSRLHEVESLLNEIPQPEPEPILFLLRPLWWCNQAFDGVTYLFGPAGTLLRSGFGRALLGLGGLALLVFSAGCLAQDWLGWTW
jgi:hypothetical protein